MRRRNELTEPRQRSRFDLSYDSDAFGQFSESIARFLGTARFLVWQTIVIIVWLALNILPPEPYQFDPWGRGLVLLTLVLSLQASYAAPLILLAQNRWATRNLIEICAALTKDQFHRRFDMGPGSLHDTARALPPPAGGGALLQATPTDPSASISRAWAGGSSSKPASTRSPSAGRQLPCSSSSPSLAGSCARGNQPRSRQRRANDPAQAANAAASGPGDPLMSRSVSSQSSAPRQASRAARAVAATGSSSPSGSPRTAARMLCSHNHSS